LLSRHLKLPVVAGIVAHGEPPGHDLAVGVEALLQADRLKQQRGDGVLERHPGDLLDDPSRQVVAGLAVGRTGTGRADQLQLVQPRHIGGQGVIARAGVGQQRPVQARGVVEQVQHGDLFGAALFLEPQLGHVPADRRVQRDLPLGDQAHQRRGRERLRDRAHLVERVRVDRQRVVEAGHTRAGVVFATPSPHPGGHARNTQFPGLVAHELRQHADHLHGFAQCSSRTVRADLNIVQVLSCTVFKSRYRWLMPRDTLTREQIVQAATDLLDSDGLEGLSMRALGERLGSAATAVYWHVGSKENLITLAGDQAWDEVALPDWETLGWREAGRQMAVGLYEMLSRHPWLMQAFGTFLIVGPGKARRDDHGLAIFEAAGFTSDQADQAAAIVFSYVLGNALGPAADASLARKLERGDDATSQLVAENLAKAKDAAARYPRLRSRLEASAAESSSPPRGSFEIGLDAILDGLETHLTQPHGHSRWSGA
jgi:AcrR family transcriptional regulator